MKLKWPGEMASLMIHDDDSLINDDQIKCTELCNCRIELYAKHVKASKGEEKQNTHAHNNTSN